MKNQFERNSTEQTCLACGETFDNRTGHYGQCYSNAANSSDEFCLCEGCAEDAHRCGTISVDALNSDVLSNADFHALRSWSIAVKYSEYAKTPADAVIKAALAVNAYIESFASKGIDLGNTAVILDTAPFIALNEAVHILETKTAI